jgi:hypothetical protein
MPGRRASRQSGPPHRKLRADGFRTGRFGEVDELLQQLARAGELVSQGAADGKVVGHSGAQPAHWAPGQGRATADSAV